MRPDKIQTSVMRQTKTGWVASFPGSDKLIGDPVPRFELRNSDFVIPDPDSPRFELRNSILHFIRGAMRLVPRRDAPGTVGLGTTIRDESPRDRQRSV